MSRAKTRDRASIALREALERLVEDGDSEAFGRALHEYIVERARQIHRELREAEEDLDDLIDDTEEDVAALERGMQDPLVTDDEEADEKGENDEDETDFDLDDEEADLADEDDIEDEVDEDEVDEDEVDFDFDDEDESKATDDEGDLEERLRALEREFEELMRYEKEEHPDLRDAEDEEDLAEDHAEELLTRLRGAVDELLASEGRNPDDEEVEEAVDFHLQPVAFEPDDRREAGAGGRKLGGPDTSILGHGRMPDPWDVDPSPMSRRGDEPSGYSWPDSAYRHRLGPGFPKAATYPRGGSKDLVDAVRKGGDPDALLNKQIAPEGTDSPFTKVNGKGMQRRKR